MVDADDVQGYRTKYENQMDLLESADIDQRDRSTINDWIVHLRTNDPDVDSLGTVVGHLNRIRLAAERANMALVDIERVEDVNTLKLHLEDVHDLSEGTIRNYMKALRKFLEYRGADWYDDVTIGAPPQRKHDPDEEITDAELDAMLDAANQFDSASREKALIALLRDTGLRIGAVLSFQMKHVDFENNRATLTINTDANVKDADGPKPVTWSRAYVANWITDHPRPDVDNAALIHKTRMWDESEDGALRQQYAGRRIQEIATAAGLNPERIHAHLFRGTAISEWMRDPEMDSQAIKHRVDWGEDSSQFEAYSRVSDEEWNDVIFSRYGIGDDDHDDAGHGLDTCPHCQSALRGGERFCPACAGPLKSAAAEKVDVVEDDNFESVANTSGNGPERDYFAEFKRRFNNDAEFRRRIAGDGHDDSS